jgi:hypothetical protein
MQIPKGQKITDVFTEFLHLWDLRTQKLGVNMLVKSTPDRSYVFLFIVNTFLRLEESKLRIFFSVVICFVTHHHYDDVF